MHAVEPSGLATVPRFLRGGGQASALIRGFDWATSPVGTPDTWPAALVTTLSIMLHSRHPMFLWWGSELVQFYNDAYIPSFGAGKHPKAMGQRGADCWPEIWPIISPQIRDVMERGIASWHEDDLVPILRNGRLEEVYWTYGYSPVFGEDGSVLGTLVICQETTVQVLQRQQIESAHRQTEAARQRLMNLFERAPGFVVALSGRDHVIALANRSYQQLVGPERGLVGKALREALPEVVEQGIIAVLDNVFNTATPRVVHEMPIRLDRGLTGFLEERIINVVSQPRRDMHGAVEGIDVFGIDVTEVAQTRLEAMRAREVSRELAEDRSAFERHLLGIVSHDLRTPMGVISLGAAYLADRAGASADSAQVILRMQSAALRAIRLINDLTDFTQVRLGDGLSIQRQSADLHEIVDTVREELAVTHPTRLIHVNHSDLGHGSWDRDRIAQLLINLVTNAIQYGAPNAPVTIRTTGTAAEVCLSVHNVGPAIPMEQRTALFEPMQRATTRNVGRSVGLGLFIVAEIAKRHGGSVELESSDDAGTTFRVHLPR